MDRKAQAGDRFGDWVVEGRLGAGGTGAVYRCHNALARRILAAVKVLHPGDVADVRSNRLGRAGVARRRSSCRGLRLRALVGQSFAERRDLARRIAEHPVG